MTIPAQPLAEEGHTGAVSYLHRSKSWLPGGILDRDDFLRTLEVFGRLARHRSRLMVLLVDLNAFQWVNDAFGIEIGDHVLDTVSRVVKRAAGPAAAVGRLDGDRFGVLVFLPTEGAAVGLAREILALVNGPIHVWGHTVHLTGRVGIAEWAPSGDSVTGTLRYAAAALAAAKMPSSSAPVVCDETRRRAVDVRANICRELHRAVDDCRLRVAYQPIVDLRSRLTYSYEALLRWRGEDGFDFPPGEFVPIAEDLGLIDRIGRWVLNEALRVGAQLGRESTLVPHIAVNLSPRQFGSPTLLESVERALSSHGFDPQYLVFEVTERIAVDDEDAPATMNALRQLGCRVGLDDFGTGQSCLSYLRSLPLDFIKIDRAFVAELDSDPKARLLIGTIATMAADLGLTTVAEGIETEAECEIAADVGCSYGQGYLFGKASFDPGTSPLV